MRHTRWYKDKVFYQIWPRSFRDGNGDGIGDLWGVLEKLDYLKELGVDGVWFSPLYPSPGADCGYDISDYMERFSRRRRIDADLLLSQSHKRRALRNDIIKVKRTETVQLISDLNMHVPRLVG